MCEHDEGCHLAVGPASPADPEPKADGSEATAGAPGPEDPTASDDVVQAVADFVDDLLDASVTSEDDETDIDPDAEPGIDGDAG